MARGFGATMGVGTTDRIVTSYTGDSGPITIGIYAFRNGDGGGGFGRMYDAFGTGARILLNRSDDSTYQFSYQWSGAGGEWRVARPSASAWHSILVRYDPGSVSNDPVVWIDGANATVTEIVAPVGSPQTSVQLYFLGNRSGFDRNWDGHLAEFFVSTRLWTDAEASAWAAAYSPLWRPRSLVSYVPMVRAEHDYCNATTTITGTAVQTHPRIVHPQWGRRGFSVAAAAVGGQPSRSIHQYRLRRVV